MTNLIMLVIFNMLNYEFYSVSPIPVILYKGKSKGKSKMKSIVIYIGLGILSIFLITIIIKVKHENSILKEKVSKMIAIDKKIDSEVLKLESIQNVENDIQDSAIFEIEKNGFIKTKENRNPEWMTKNQRIRGKLDGK